MLVEVFKAMYGLILLMDFNSKKSTTVLSNQAIKVIKATARITPGIAYPEIEKVVRKLKNLLRETRFP